MLLIDSKIRERAKQALLFSEAFRWHPLFKSRLGCSQFPASPAARAPGEGDVSCYWPFVPSPGPAGHGLPAAGGVLQWGRRGAPRTGGCVCVGAEVAGWGAKARPPAASPVPPSDLTDPVAESLGPCGLQGGIRVLRKVLRGLSTVKVHQPAFRPPSPDLKSILRPGRAVTQDEPTVGMMPGRRWRPHGPGTPASAGVLLCDLGHCGHPVLKNAALPRRSSEGSLKHGMHPGWGGSMD